MFKLSAISADRVGSLAIPVGLLSDPVGTRVAKTLCFPMFRLDRPLAHPTPKVYILITLVAYIISKTIINMYRNSKVSTRVGHLVFFTAAL